ncbi:MAG TPA: hypothetical protein ENN40_07515 [Candidatus Aminicenantes bacterium]|nr:hypothetical protein [Candidatus Aminicenantes bacterium]
MINHEWFSVDARAHMRKLSDFHFHHPGGFILDLIRGAVKRGARRVRVELSPGCVRVADNGSTPSRQTLESLRLLAKPGINENRLEHLIHELLDPPGIGWLAVFAPSPLQATIRVRRESQWKRIDLFPFHKSPQGNSQTDVMTGMNTVVSVLIPENTLPCSLSRLRESCRAATARIEVNDQLVKQGHLLSHTFLARQLRHRSSAAPAIMALPEKGEACRLVLTDTGIPWDEMNLPPLGGLVFHLQFEHPHPPGTEFLSVWTAPARRLYSLAAAEFKHLKPNHRKRLEELFFQLYRQSGDDSLFRNAPIFTGMKMKGPISLADIEFLAASAPISFRLHHNHMPPTIERHTPVLHLTSLQLDFLNRKGLRLRKAPDPVILKDSTYRRVCFLLKKATILLTRLRFRDTKPLSLEQLLPQERALVKLLSDSLSRPGPGSPPGTLPPIWNPVVLDCRAWIPVWPGAKLGDFNFRDLIFARRHPDFHTAASRLQQAPHEKDLICAAFRPAVRNTGVDRKTE